MHCVGNRLWSKVVHYVGNRLWSKVVHHTGDGTRYELHPKWQHILYIGLVTGRLQVQIPELTRYKSVVLSLNRQLPHCY